MILMAESAEFSEVTASYTHTPVFNGALEVLVPLHLQHIGEFVETISAVRYCSKSSKRRSERLSPGTIFCTVGNDR